MTNTIYVYARHAAYQKTPERGVEWMALSADGTLIYQIHIDGDDPSAAFALDGPFGDACREKLGADVDLAALDLQFVEVADVPQSAVAAYLLTNPPKHA